MGAVAIDMLVADMSTADVLIINVPVVGLPKAETYLSNIFLTIFTFLFAKIVK